MQEYHESTWKVLGKYQETIGKVMESHKKCTICDKVCPTKSSFESHMKAFHWKPSSKHSLEREPSLKNYKNKSFNQKIY